MPIRHALYYIVLSHNLDKERGMHLNSTKIFKILQNFYKGIADIWDH